MGNQEDDFTKHFKKLFFLLFFLFISVAIKAQSEIIVKGVITDENKAPLPGVSVFVKGTTIGTLSDVDGNYYIELPKEYSILSYSFIGFAVLDEMIDDRTVVDVTLLRDDTMLDDIVVVGYGATNKSNISGAVSTVKVDELPTAGAPSVGSMLRGRSAGMNITSNSASPGASMNIAIRGGLSGQKPLIVIDGVPQLQTNTVSTGTSYSGVDKDNSLMNINPDDIETINILKDASAASIYGSDASGGVILITTKRGKSSKPEVSYSGSFALQKIKDAPDFMNARDFMQEQNKVFEELGRSDEKIFTQEYIDNFEGDGTDWMDEVTRTGMVSEHTISVNGGSKTTHYLFSTGVFQHEGIAKNNDMNRITGRLNLDQDFGEKLKAGVSTSFTQLKYNDVPLGDGTLSNSALIYSAMTFIPVVPVYDENGDFSDNFIRPNVYPNPVSLLEITDETLSRELFINGFIEYRPWKDLTIRATGGVDMKDTQLDQYIPTTTQKGYSLNGQASKQNSKAQMNVVNVIATYKKQFVEKHRISIMAGWEYKKKSWSGMGIVASDFPTDAFLMNNIASSEQENPSIWSNKGRNEMASYMSRFEYVLHNRYVLNLNIRIDGSSNFSPKYQWGYFPGASAAWRINEENWLKKIDWLSNLKLRLGYGQTGNSGNLTGVNTSYAVKRGSYAMDGNLSNGIGLARIGNSNLKWETLTDINAGIDFGFWREHLSGSIDVYQRIAKDIIVAKQLMSYQEVSSVDYNSDMKYQSRGIDIGIHSLNIVRPNFEWSTDVNLSFYRNRTITRDPEFIAAPYQKTIEDWNNIYGYQTSGLIQEGNSYSHLPSSAAGGILYNDLYSYQLNEMGERVRDDEGRYIRQEGPDGILDAVDMVYLYNSTPIPFSINNTFRWKNLDANIYIYGSLNGWKINDVKYQSVYGIESLTYGVNALTEVKKRWSQDNPNGTLPGVAEATSGVTPSESDFFYEQAWYLRLDNISVGYTFPANWFNGHIRYARIYVSARNIMVFTPYKGMDPETGNGIGAYPSADSFAFGLNVKF